ncbi:hypothetical protein VTH06DRAFT_7035 [Thermothelomyces fergusii]
MASSRDLRAAGRKIQRQAM